MVTLVKLRDGSLDSECVHVHMYVLGWPTKVSLYFMHVLILGKENTFSVAGIFKN